MDVRSYKKIKLDRIRNGRIRGIESGRKFKESSRAEAELVRAYDEKSNVEKRRPLYLGRRVVEVQL